MKLLQINTTVNSGSTGRIAEAIGVAAMQRGHESHIAFGRGNQPTKSHQWRIGNTWDMYYHGAMTRLFDRHGLASKNATKRLLQQWQINPPDVIGLHNLHGYYLHYPSLFSYIKRHQIPTVWTFHDCWPFTGHCAYFESVGCERWMNQCNNCPQQKAYPASLRDRSYKNFKDKKNSFKGVQNLHIVTPSKWLANLVQQSFLQEYPLHIIHNGVDLTRFSINNVRKEKLVLGVASIWSNRKGLQDFVFLRSILPSDWAITLIGLSSQQIKQLPQGIKGIRRTESIDELVTWYNKAAVFVNPTYSDNFPTTNIEALACGTPVVTYNTGGSPEAIDQFTGRIVEKGNIKGILQAIEKFQNADQIELTHYCRSRAEKYFNEKERYEEYVNLYQKAIN